MENRIKEIRKEKKLGQAYLYENLGISRQALSAIENGKATPSLDLAMDIAYLLDMPLDKIFIHKNRFKSSKKKK